VSEEIIIYASEKDRIISEFLAEHFLIKEKMDEEFLRNLRINN
jgi:hypothetical protein